MTATNVRVQMQQRRDTAANWTAAGPTLLAGEIGYETDTGRIKIGDGSTAWASLAYLPIPSSTGELDDDLTITGNLTVQGTTTTIESTTLTIEDKNIEMAVVDAPTDATADGGGITLKGATDKTINWVDATDAWTFSEHIDIASAKEFRIAGTKVLDATSLGSAVVGSSLTSVGTIGTGTWQGTAIDAAYLDPTVVTTGDTGSVTSTMITDGTIVNADINASAEIAVSKLADGAARQLLQTDAAGTGVEWASNIDIPGTLDVTSAATFDSTVTATGLITANGKVSFPAGTAAAPSLYSGSDTDTGIYSPGSDQLAISTSGTAALTVDSSQRVGIGTASPAGPLEIKYSGNDSGLFITADDNLSWGYSPNIYFRAELTNAGGIGTSGRISSVYESSNNFGMSFYTTAAGSNGEKVRIDSSGRLLVGTTSTTGPDIKDAYYAYLQVQGNTAGTDGRLALVRNEDSTSVSSGEDLGLITFNDRQGGYYAHIAAKCDGAVSGSGDSPGRLVFSVTADGAPSPTERMRINNSGISFIYSDTDPLIIGSALSAGTSNRLINGIYNRTSTTGGGTTSFKVYTNGNVENTNDAYGQISDVKLKENIVDAPSQWDDFKAVRFRKYNFKEESGYETFTQLGVIAQELELTSPGLVYETADQDAEGNDLGTTTKAVKSSVLTKKALVALQEAMARIEQLEAKVAALEAS